MLRRAVQQVLSSARSGGVGLRSVVPRQALAARRFASSGPVTRIRSVLDSQGFRMLASAGASSVATLGAYKLVLDIREAKEHARRREEQRQMEEDKKAHELAVEADPDYLALTNISSDVRGDNPFVHYVPRRGLLETLSEIISTKGRLLITGMFGTGKTWLAEAWLAEKAGRNPQAIVWVLNCRSEADFNASLSELLQRLGGVPANKRTSDKLIQEIAVSIGEQKTFREVYFILDNLNDDFIHEGTLNCATARRILAPMERLSDNKILFVPILLSRNASARTLSEYEHCSVSLNGGMSDDEITALIRRHAQKLSRSQALELADLLARHPMACKQAAIYIYFESRNDREVDNAYDAFCYQYNRAKRGLYSTLKKKFGGNVSETERLSTIWLATIIAYLGRGEEIAVSKKFPDGEEKILKVDRVPWASNFIMAVPMLGDTQFPEQLLRMWVEVIYRPLVGIPARPMTIEEETEVHVGVLDVLCNFERASFIELFKSDRSVFVLHELVAQAGELYAEMTAENAWQEKGRFGAIQHAREAKRRMLEEEHKQGIQASPRARFWRALGYDEKPTFSEAEIECVELSDEEALKAAYIRDYKRGKVEPLLKAFDAYLLSGGRFPTKQPFSRSRSLLNLDHMQRVRAYYERHLNDPSDASPAYARLLYHIGV